MEKVKKTKRQMLRKEFDTIYMKEFENIDSFFTQVVGLVTEITAYGETLKDGRIVQKILRSFPSRFDPIVVAIEETKDISQFSVYELHASLIFHEHVLNRI